MPTTKNALQRYKVLDRCFNDPLGKYSVQDLLDIVADDIFDKCGSSDGISLRQLREDMRIMKTNGAPIYVKHSGKQNEDGKMVPIYYYGHYETGERISYQYFATTITPETKGRIQSTIELLQLYQDLPGFNWIQDIIAQLEIEFDETSRQDLVSFERNPDLKGLNWLSALIKHTMRREPLRITYTPFFGDKRKIIFHPYHLRQFNNRWFLWGLDADRHVISNLALDRIDNFVPIEIPFIKNDQIDFSKYFDDVIGVSVPGTDVPVETIVLRFSEKRLPYVLNKPIHRSQQLHPDIPNAVILRLKPNREFEARILNYGPDVEVLAPESLRSAIAEKVRMMTEIYLR